MSSAPTKSDQPDYDPVFLHARREAVVIFCVWFIGMIWAVPICYFNGYMSNIENFDPNNVSTIIGIPTWLFWGIFVPWIAADIFTTWFCFSFMKDDDLGQEPPPEELKADSKEKESDK